MAAQPIDSAESGKSTDLSQLHDAIESMDDLSQEVCTEIITVAKLARSVLERASTRDEIETVALAIHIMQSKAEVMDNDINVEASELGCSQRKRGLE